MQTSTRNIFNSASAAATEEGPDVREEMVAEMESYREQLGVSAKEVDRELGRPVNWYSNHRSGGTHSHEFSYADFLETTLALQHWAENGELSEGDLESIRDGVSEAREKRLSQISEVIGELPELNVGQLERALNRPGGWFSERRENTDYRDDDFTGFSLSVIVQMYVFLEAAVVMAEHENLIDETVDEAFPVFADASAESWLSV